MQAGEAEIDLEAQEVRFGDTVARFEIDPETKHRLLNGLDDIALTLAAGGGDRRLRVRARALRAGHDGAVMTGAVRDWNADAYHRVSGPQVAMARRCSTASSCAATRPCSTPAAARAASRGCCSSGCRAGA